MRSSDALSPVYLSDQHPLIGRLQSYVDLATGEIATLTSLLARVREVRRGREIIVQGQPYHSLVILNRGLALRYKVLQNGKRQVLNLVVPGDLIGLPACLFENAIGAVSCLTDGSICTVAFTDLFDVFRRHPRIGVALFWISARETAIYAERLATIGRRSAYERMAHLILEVLLRLQAVGLADATSFEMPMTQEMLADSLGLSLQHVNRMIRNLREEGLASVEEHKVVIQDFDSMVRLAGFEATYLLTHRISGLGAL